MLEPVAQPKIHRKLQDIMDDLPEIEADDFDTAFRTLDSDAATDSLDRFSIGSDN